MARGARLAPAQGDTYTVPFFINKAGTDENVTFSSTTETLMKPFSPVQTGGSITGVSHAVIPFPAQIVGVFGGGQFLADEDTAYFRVFRHASGGTAAGSAVINNSTDGTNIVNYFRVVSTGIGAKISKYYAGTPENEGTTADGFVDAQSTFAAGDAISMTIDMEAAADSITHCQGVVVFARIGE